MICGARFVMRTGAMCTTVEFCRCFYPMADDPASAMAAYGCQTMDRAFEAVEDVGFTADSNFKRKRICVAATLAYGRGKSPCFGPNALSAPGFGPPPFVIRQPLPIAAQPAKIE